MTDIKQIAAAPPVYHLGRNYEWKCLFYTADGKKHDVACKWCSELQCYVLKYNGTTYRTDAPHD